MIIRWSRIIDTIAAYFIRKSETRPDDLAPEAEHDRRVTVIFHGGKIHKIN
jgi:hypothetical protein